MRDRVLSPGAKGKATAPPRGQPDRGRGAHTPHVPITCHDVGVEEAFLLIEEHDISIKVKYIRSAANVWADRLSRETDNADWQLAIRVFRYYEK